MAILITLSGISQPCFVLIHSRVIVGFLLFNQETGPLDNSARYIFQSALEMFIFYLGIRCPHSIMNL